MRCSNCGICCTETEMLLSDKDITRLIKKGFNKGFFVKFDKEGYSYLKNRQGFCVFFEPKQSRCNVYADRPLGCQVYPVIVDEDKIILDKLCPEIDSISEEEKDLKGKTVIRLLQKIDAEAARKTS